MRATVGVSLVADGIAYFLDRPNPLSLASLIVVVGLMSGTLLLIGYLTPAAGVLAALCSLGRMSSQFLLFAGSLLDSRAAITFEMSIAVALAFLGPGAFSLDARLFGRREIIIPRTTLPPS